MEYFMTKRQPAESPATIAESQAMPTTNYYQKINKTEDIYIYIYICSSFCCGFAVWVRFIVCRSFAFFGNAPPQLRSSPDRQMTRSPDPQNPRSSVWVQLHRTVRVACCHLSFTCVCGLFECRFGSVCYQLRITWNKYPQSPIPRPQSAN